jgi:hypothetical protein
VSKSTHSDQNRIFPPRVNEKSTEAWKQQRIKMRKYIVEQTIKKLTQEDLIQMVSQQINEKYFYATDMILLAQYRSLGGST